VILLGVRAILRFLFVAVLLITAVQMGAKAVGL